MPVSLERNRDVAVLTIDNPPQTATSRAVRAALVQRLTEANADGEIGAIVLAPAGHSLPVRM